MTNDIQSVAARVRRSRMGETVTSIYGGKLKPLLVKGEVISHLEDPSACEKWHNDTETVVSAYLAEHPPDDHELVTPDWLNGLRRDGGDMSFLCIRLVHNEIRLMSPCNDYVAAKHATRGDIRRIAAALGITLIENDLS